MLYSGCFLTTNFMLVTSVGELGIRVVQLCCALDEGSAITVSFLCLFSKLCVTATH